MGSKKTFDGENLGDNEHRYYSTQNILSAINKSEI